MSSQKTKDTERPSTEAEIEKLLNYLRQDYSSGLGLDNETLGDVIHEIEDIIRSGNPAGGSEDAESDENHCTYAAKGCDCDGCEECKDNDMKSEDAEEQYDKSQNSPYTRGEFDSYNRHPKRPHYYIKVEGGKHRVEEKDMTPEEIKAYYAGFEANEKARDWREY